ncbi:MAG: hypothetical protein LBP67_01120 [Bacteroidales bacterium]|nr:hypothetical protein [Bacteroidales bacterium]
MNVTIDVICYKSKVLANSESPLMLKLQKTVNANILASESLLIPFIGIFRKTNLSGIVLTRIRLSVLFPQKLQIVGNRFLI